MKNGQIWQDISGQDIQAHGGCIICHEGTYYWYGEHKGVDNCQRNNNGEMYTLSRVDVVGVSCYSSKNLVDWKYEGLALAAEPEDPASPLHPSKVVERPKVIYNEKNKQFVMWMHLDDAHYFFAGIGVAVSDKPQGPFRLIRAEQPNRQDSRDMTVFQDVDGKAYLVHSKDWNKTMNIARLNEDYTATDGFYVSVMADQEREAPALCYHNGMYYMVTSGCSGWSPNAALFSTCPHLLGKWKLIDNPCVGPNARQTFFGQSTYIFQAEGKFYLMLDHWIPKNLKKSGYSILPITFEADGSMTVQWQEEWKGIEA